MLPPDATAMFLACCGSNVWAVAMENARPYPLIEPLLEKADSLWSALSNADRLEAYSISHGYDHPESSDDDAISELTKVYRLYRDKFGIIFVLNTSGKSIIEVLTVCKARFGNSVETELAIAAEEQRKIIQFRLTKFLEK